MLVLVARGRKASNTLLFAATSTATAAAFDHSIGGIVLRQAQRTPLLGQVEAVGHHYELVVVVLVVLTAIVHHAAASAVVAAAARQTLLLLQYNLLLFLLCRRWWRGFFDRFRRSAFVGNGDNGGGGWSGHFDGAPDARSEVEAVAAEHPFAEELAVVVGRDEVDAHDHLLVDGDVAEAHKVLAARRLDVACDAHETNGKVGASPRQLAAVLDQPRLLEANVGLQLRAVRYVVVLEERGRERSSNLCAISAKSRKEEKNVVFVCLPGAGELLLDEGGLERTLLAFGLHEDDEELVDLELERDVLAEYVAEEVVAARRLVQGGQARLELLLELVEYVALELLCVEKLRKFSLCFSLLYNK